MIRTGFVICTLVTGILSALSTVTHAQQWNGAGNSKGMIWRPGNVAVGEEPQRREDPKAMIEVTRPLASSNDQDDGLFSANMTYKGEMSPKFEVDTRRAYAGGARSKSGILPADLDFAVHRSAAIGVVNIDEMPRPNDYTLLVGGKVLAEEVRIKLIKDWADYVFEPGYRLKSLPEVEAFIRDNHHLPDLPSATDVAEHGVDLGRMQSTLLAKIEELTLYVIEQQNDIEALRGKVRQLEREHAPTRPTTAGSPLSPREGERIGR
jgi:hypothetical protein